MKLRNIIIAIAAWVGLLAQAQTAGEHMFPYPEPPEELTTLQERTTYLVEHFWERCQLPTAAKFRDKFTEAFNDYVSFMPYADAKAVHESVEKLIDKFKKNPDLMLTLGEVAENALYGPEAEIVSDEVYLPFAQAVAAQKKIPKDKKERFARQAKVLSVSQVGMQAPDFAFTKPDGSQGKLSDITSGHTLILFDTEGCTDCFFARVKLSADANVNQLIEKEKLNVVYIKLVADKAQAQSEASALAGMNSRWIVGVAEGIPEIYDLRNAPVFYYLNPKGEILSKTLLADNLLEAFRVVNNSK